MAKEKTKTTFTEIVELTEEVNEQISHLSDGLSKKKKTEKKETAITTSIDVQVLKLTNELRAQAKDIYELNQRIDRLVDAIDKSRKVKGI